MTDPWDSWRDRKGPPKLRSSQGYQGHQGIVTDAGEQQSCAGCALEVLGPNQRTREQHSGHQKCIWYWIVARLTSEQLEGLEKSWKA